jgi:hypothetical protein
MTVGDMEVFMGEKIKILVPALTGGMTETVGQNMEIIESKELWSEYVLDDGTKIKAKPVVVSIVKLDQKAPDGTDVYVMQGQTIMHVPPKI